MTSSHDGSAVKPSKNEVIYVLAIIGENVAVLNQQMETIHSSVCPDATDEQNVSKRTSKIVSRSIFGLDKYIHIPERKDLP